jgi:MFS family permease
LYPDGVDHPPLSEAEDQVTEPISLKQILTDVRAWQLIVSYGILQFVIVAMMAYMAVRYISLSTPQDVPNLFVSKALFWLAIGAASGIPMSYVLGWIDDKIGSIKASFVLNLLFFIAVIPLAIMPVGGNTLLMFLWAIGVACMTGGLPTMHPCVTSYVYGRKQYMAANRWIMTIQAIPMSFAIAFMGIFNQMGKLTQAYYVLMGLLVVSLITILTMWKIPDANELDREYGAKVE